MTTHRYDLSRLVPTGERAADAAEHVPDLDAAWEDPGTRIHVIVAPRGTGNTGVVHHWLAGLEKEGFPGADQVLGWSFHGQGFGPAAASCDAFLDHALRHFDDADPTSGSPWDRGVRLAHLVQAQRTLLVLDGVGSQQVKDGEGRWRFRHPALAALVKILNRHNPGLCEITGDNRVAELDDEEGVTHLDLGGSGPEEPEPAAREAEARDAFERYLKSRPPTPTTPDQLFPLCDAVIYGCRAGKVEAAYRLYQDGIVRPPSFISTLGLGAFAAEDATLRAFFETPWTTLRTGLGRDDEGALRLAAGVNLRSLGCLKEAEEALRAARGGEQDPKRAADVESLLGEVLLARGKITVAIEAAGRAVAHAEEAGDGFRRTAKRAYKADTLHQAGRTDESREEFEAAEKAQAAWEEDYPRLYSLRGYQYHDLLLGDVEAALLGPAPSPSEEELEGVRKVARKVLDRVQEQIDEWRNDRDSQLDRGLEHLARGRARLLLALAGPGEGKDRGLREVGEDLNEAVRRLRRYAGLHRLPLGLLARAAYRRVTGDLGGAEGDLDEVLDLAEHTGMRLVEADAHLERARLDLAREDRTAARDHLAKARAAITDTGYRRRARDATALEAALA